MCPLEKYLIEHCSPTLASLKTASLFRLPVFSKKEVAQQLGYWNRVLEPKGVSIDLLCFCGSAALVYVYRRSQLYHRLKRPEVVQFLSSYGYSNFEVKDALFALRTRLTESAEFPHEIGIFLGYPLEDVIGFIQNGGQNSKCTGCWKVYVNEAEAKKQFEQFKKCREIYSKLWSRGRSIWKLTVAA